MKLRSRPGVAALAASSIAVTGAVVGFVAPASAATPIVSGAAVTDEGAQYELTLASSDGSASMLFAIDWGDGTLSATVLLPPGVYRHVYTDDVDGPVNEVVRTITVAAYEGTGSTLVQLPVTVRNVAPVVSLSGSVTAAVGSPYALTVGSLSDPGTDTVTSRTLHWGDGTSDVVAGSGALTHTYAVAGPMTVTLVATDEDGTFVAGTLALTSVLQPPSTPTGLTATATGRSTVRLVWTNTSATAAAIEIERCKGSGCTRFTRIATVAGTASSFVDGTVSPRTTYTYRVRARNSAGVSGYTTGAVVTTPR